MGENKYLSFEEFYRMKYPEGYSYAMKSRSKNQTFGGDVWDRLSKGGERNLLARLKRKDPSLFSEKGFNELEKKVMENKKIRMRLEAMKIVKKSKNFKKDQEEKLYDGAVKLLFGDLSKEVRTKYSLSAVRLFVKTLNLGVIRCPRYSPSKELEGLYKRVPELFKNKSYIEILSSWRYRALHQPNLEGMSTIEEAEVYWKNDTKKIEKLKREVERLRRICKN